MKKTIGNLGKVKKAAKSIASPSNYAPARTGTGGSVNMSQYSKAGLKGKS
jgi:hypothetical protein